MFIPSVVLTTLLLIILKVITVKTWLLDPKISETRVKGNNLNNIKQNKKYLIHVIKFYYDKINYAKQFIARLG